MIFDLKYVWKFDVCVYGNADVVVNAGLQGGWTIVHSVELVYNLRGLHPSPSLMDGGVCTKIERGVDVGWRISSWRAPSAHAADKESLAHFLPNQVHATG